MLLKVKGGGQMNQITGFCVETMKRVLSGKIPSKAAEINGKVAHAAAQNSFAEVKMRDRVNDEQLAKELSEATEAIKAI
jgi:hypothetical protein